ncbi:hypothetical protein HDU97_010120 [Phlyctochytrium planicorne]|nr:hypothetical protein HDU97_010120 [Phlyctochytrium planicorne]
MELELEQYNYALKRAQTLHLNSSRTSFLREQLSQQLERQQRTLEPYAYRYAERPWVVGNSRHSWIGERAIPSESATEDDLWAAMRHGEARQFPLEMPNVSQELFRNLYRAIGERDGGELWQGRDEKQIPDDGIYLASPTRQAETTRPHTSLGISNGGGCEGSQDETSDAGDRTLHLLPTVSASAWPHPVDLQKPLIMLSLSLRKSNNFVQPQFQPLPFYHGDYFFDIVITTLIMGNIDRYNEIMRRMSTRSAEARSRRILALTNSRKPFSFCDNPARGSTCGCKSHVTNSLEQAFTDISKHEMKNRRARSLHRTPEESIIKDAAEAENERRAGLTREHKFHPEINEKIPNYDQLLDEFRRSTSHASFKTTE